MQPRLGASARPVPTSPDLAALLALGLIWGATPLLVKLVVEHVPPLLLVAGRVWAGLAVILGFTLLRGQTLPTDGRTWGHLMVLGTVGTAMPWIVLAWAQQTMSPGLAAILLAPLPATTLALAVAGRLERLTWRNTAGMSAALFGVLVVLGGSAGGGRAVSVAAAAACTCLFAFGTVYAKRFLHGVPGMTVATGQLVPSALLLVPAVLVHGDGFAWGAVPAFAWGAWIAIGALSTGLAYGIFYRLVERVGASFAQLSVYLVPPVGILLGWGFAGDRMGARAVVGMALVGVGVWLTEGRVPDVPTPAAVAQRLRQLRRRPGAAAPWRAGAIARR